MSLRGTDRNTETPKLFAHPPRWFMALGYLIMGLTALTIGGANLYSKYEFQTFGLSAVAEVVDIKESPGDETDHDSRKTYAPTFRFVSSKGDTITAQYRYYTDRSIYQKGQRVTVYYIPKYLPTVELGLMEEDTIIYGILTVVGVVVIISSIVKFRQAGLSVLLNQPGDHF